MIGLIFLGAFFYIIQLVLVVVGLAHDIDENEKEFFKNVNQFLICLIPFSIYIMFIVGCWIEFKEHFKKETDD